MKLRTLLETTLLVGAAFETGCGFTGSCPDTGAPPPVAQVKTVAANYAGGGGLTGAQCDEVCVAPNSYAPKAVTCVRDSATEVLCFVPPIPCEGRRPPGLRSIRRDRGRAIAGHLAEVAWLEAASVDAFRILGRELAAHDAPVALRRAAARAARDEERHARVTTALARRYGGFPPPVAVAPRPVRSLAAIAVENAVEGCVRETWGALVALGQAARAADPVVRAAMVRIASDEVRHAELAWQIDAWIRPRLARADVQRVTRARRSAVRKLARDGQAPLDLATRHALGLPGAPAARAMAAELTRALWERDSPERA